MYLDISMHYIHRVHVANGITDTVEDSTNHAFVFESMLSDEVEEGPILCIL